MISTLSVQVELAIAPAVWSKNISYSIFAVNFSTPFLIPLLVGFYKRHPFINMLNFVVGKSLKLQRAHMVSVSGQISFMAATGSHRGVLLLVFYGLWSDARFDVLAEKVLNSQVSNWCQILKCSIPRTLNWLILILSTHEYLKLMLGNSLNTAAIIIGLRRTKTAITAPA